MLHVFVCFAEDKFDKGTISVKGGGAGGVKRHLMNNHTQQFDSLDAGKCKNLIVGVGGSTNSIFCHFKPRGRELSLEDTRSLFVMVGSVMGHRQHNSIHNVCQSILSKNVRVPKQRCV